MIAAADGNYSFNPWMRPEVRLGDDVDPSPVLDGMAVVAEMVALTPEPPSAGYTPRLGYPTGEPTIEDVLAVGPSAGLMRDTPTSQDSGMQGTLRPASSPW